MKIIEHEFVGLPRYIATVGNYWSELGWIFRGQTKGSNEWPLLPKAGRPEYFTEATDYWKEKNQTSSDLGKFGLWRKNAVAFSDKLPTNDFDCLAFAQHYGLATRLLDWTTNPLVALFFAVETDLNVDGAVFCHLPRWVIEHDKISLEDMKDVAELKPSPFDRRIAAQSSMFTYHPNPKQPLTPKQTPSDAKDDAPEGVDLVTIRVDAKMKQILQRQLSSVGISRKVLFPDLEGLSSFINWSTRKYADVQYPEDSENSPAL